VSKQTSDQQQTSTTGVVVSNTKPHLANKGPLIVILAIAIIGGIITGLIINHNSKPNPNQDLSQQQLSNQAYAAAFKKNPQAAVSLIKSQKTQTADTDSLLASIYANEGNYTAALQVYATLQKNNQMTGALAAGAASIAQQAKNIPLAITYYKEAAQLTLQEKAGPTYVGDAKYYSYIAQQLQSQQ
jgi:tetratricopeptide (TPR) repeat protein